MILIRLKTTPNRPMSCSIESQTKNHIKNNIHCSFVGCFILSVKRRIFRKVSWNTERSLFVTKPAWTKFLLMEIGSIEQEMKSVRKEVKFEGFHKTWKGQAGSGWNRGNVDLGKIQRKKNGKNECQPIELMFVCIRRWEQKKKTILNNQ